jgi:hypothetical protein
VYNILRFTIKAGWANNYKLIVEELSKLMNDVIDPDFDWRCRFDWILFRCLFEDDSGKNAAGGVLTKIWNQIVSNKEGGMKLSIEQEEEFLRICTHYGVNT